MKSFVFQISSTEQCYLNLKRLKVYKHTNFFKSKKISSAFRPDALS